MTYSIWLTWLLRLITAFVLLTVKIKDHICYSSELESNIKNIQDEASLFRKLKEYYRQFNKFLLGFKYFLIL